MKYLLTGAQGTGKTSIMDALSCDVQKIQNVTRTCIANNNLTINENSDDNTQKAIFDAYYKALTENDNYIAERSLFDVYAYSWYQFFNKKCSSDVLLKQKQLISEFIKNNPDTIYFYIPIEFDIIPDGTRSLNKIFQQSIDKKIYDLLNHYGCKYYKITGTIQERASKIQEIIGQNQ